MATDTKIIPMRAARFMPHPSKRNYKTRVYHSQGLGRCGNQKGRLKREKWSSEVSWGRDTWKSSNVVKIPHQPISWLQVAYKSLITRHKIAKRWRTTC